jgi:hypothetical protein
MIVNCNTNGGAHVSYQVVARRQCGPVDLPIVCNPPPGSFFKEGVNTVTCSVLDPRNNQPVTCTFTITVRCGATPAIGVVKSADGRSFTLTWGANAVLEVTTDLGGTWTPVANAQGSHTVTPTGKQAFYRLRIIP